MWSVVPLRCGCRAVTPLQCPGVQNRRGSHVWVSLRRAARPQPRRALSILRHMHLGGDDGQSLVSYDRAEAVQEEHRASILAWKASQGRQMASEFTFAVGEPEPLVISFESMPTYTLGRRQEDLTPEQSARLRRPLEVSLMHRGPQPERRQFHPQVRKTNRGGLTTYHGPGQLVLWPVINMRSSLYPQYGVASYANHLETTTQRLLSDLFGIETYLSREEPGVWVSTSGGRPRKIAAMGVHHRRYVTALGIAVNFDIPVAGNVTVNPWARFVPCGLDGKLVTSVAAELETEGGRVDWDLGSLGARWADLFEEGLLDKSKRNEGDGRLR